MKTICKYTEKELDNMSQEEIDKLPTCGISQCFECYGDSTNEY